MHHMLFYNDSYDPGLYGRGMMQQGGVDPAMAMMQGMQQGGRGYSPMGDFRICRTRENIEIMQNVDDTGNQLSTSLCQCFRGKQMPKTFFSVITRQVVTDPIFCLCKSCRWVVSTAVGRTKISKSCKTLTTLILNNQLHCLSVFVATDAKTSFFPCDVAERILAETLWFENNDAVQLNTETVLPLRVRRVPDPVSGHP